MHRRKFLSAAVLFLACWAVYAPFHTASFQFDDALFLQDDNVRLGRWEAFLWPPMPRSLTWITFALQYQASGPSPWAFFAFNLLLHALNSVLVFLLLGALLDGDSPQIQPPAPSPQPPVDGDSPRNMLAELTPFLGALLFAWHPLQTQAVYYIYQRSTLLATFFLLAALLLERRRRPAAALVCFLLGLAAKEVAIAFPAAVWLVRGLSERRWKPDAWLAAYWATALAAGAGFAAWVAVSGEATLGGGFRQAADYAATQVQSAWTYLRLAFLPYPLNLDHDVPAADLSDPLWWTALVGWIAAGFLLWRYRKRRPRYVLLASLFLLLLLPSSSIFPSRDYFFEHRAYPAMAAFCGWAALLLSDLWNVVQRLRPKMRRALRVGWAALLLTLLSLSVWAIRGRGLDWGSPERLWRDTAAKSPGKFRPHYNLGVVLMETDAEEAERQLLQAAALAPGEPRVYRSLGQLYFNLEDLENARQAWQQALQLDPNDAPTHIALGRLAVEQRDFVQARRHLDRARELDAEDWRPDFYLARLHLNFGLYAQAAGYAEQGLRLDPVQPELRFLLADAVRLNGDPARAVQLYRQGLEMAPGSSEAYFKMAQAYRQLGESEAACRTVRQGMAAAPESEGLQSLGRAMLKQIPCPP